MLKKLQLTNFRGFEQLEFKQLNRANLIVGGNNTGKTSILEALVLLGGAEEQIKSLPTTFRPAPDFKDGYGQRTADALQILEESYWLWLYREKDSSQGFSLSCTLSDGSSWISQSARSRAGFRGYEDGQTGANPEKQWIDVGSQSLFIGKTPESKTGALNVISSGASNPTRDAELFNLVAPLDPDGEDEIEAAMRVIDTRVKRLRYARLPGTTSPQIFVDVGLRKAIPSTQLGQAFGRMLHMNCLLMAKRSPLLLVDEIENGLYFENLGAFWSGAFSTLERLDTQLFASTHSFECMKAAHQAACERADKNGGNYDLNIIRLDRVDWGIKATEFGRETMEVAIAKGWEMR